jgi:hypothetical protein
MSLVDEQTVVLSKRRSPVFALWTVAVATLLSASGCVFTKVAIITVRNETPTTVEVHPHLRGHADLDEPPVALKPQQEEVMVKYEESRFSPEPVSDYVLGLRLVAPNACVAALDGGAVVRAAERSETHRRWTIRVTPQVLETATCKVTP